MVKSNRSSNLKNIVDLVRIWKNDVFNLRQRILKAFQQRRVDYIYWLNMEFFKNLIQFLPIIEEV